MSIQRSEAAGEDLQMDLSDEVAELLAFVAEARGVSEEEIVLTALRELVEGASKSDVSDQKKAPQS